MNYIELNNLFKNNEFRKIDKEPNANKFYLLRSISKSRTMKDFCKEFNVKSDLNSIMDNKKISEDDIINFIKRNYRPIKKEQIDEIEIELNKMQNFDWGGSQGNNLEKNIINNFVKKIMKYDEIENAIVGNIQKSVYGYTLNSWYNHWSTIMIENIFKNNSKILPTIELIEKIDFFLEGVPYDLKTTYFPEELIKKEIRPMLLEKYDSTSELTCMKKLARELDIGIPSDLNDRALTICLENLLKESVDGKAKNFINDIRDMKRKIISSYKDNPNKLIIWLYENQGEMRFDAANRFYLVLTDLDNPFDSWKIKRNKKLLQDRINEKLNTFDKANKNKILFHWEKNGKDYECYSEILFVDNLK